MQPQVLLRKPWRTAKPSSIRDVSSKSRSWRVPRPGLRSLEETVGQRARHPGAELVPILETFLDPVPAVLLLSLRSFCGMSLHLGSQPQAIWKVFVRRRNYSSSIVPSACVERARRLWRAVARDLFRPNRLCEKARARIQPLGRPWGRRPRFPAAIFPGSWILISVQLVRHAI